MNRTAMRTKRGYTRVWLATLCVAAGASVLAGCELLVDFDRSKIPTGGQGDASLLDSGAPGLDGSVDGLAPDGGSDAAADGQVADGAADGATTDGATTDGAAIDGAATDGAATDGAATDGAATDGATDGAADADDGATVSDASDDGG